MHSSYAEKSGRRQVVLMAKAPGESAKTRLRAHLSDAQRQALVLAMLKDTLQTLLALQQAHPELSLHLSCAPAPDAPGFEALWQWLDRRPENGNAAGPAPGSATRSAQRGNSLGERLHHALVQAQDAGAEQVVFLGSDSPTLPPSHIQQAFEALDSHDVVLGPAFDGGYYLLGLKRALPAVLEDIPWSTPEVLRLTCERSNAAGHSLHLLPFWYDVDEPADVTFLRAHLSSLRASGEREAGHETARVLAEMLEPHDAPV